MKRGSLFVIVAVVGYLFVVVALFFRGIPTTEELLILVAADLPIGLILLAAQKALESHEQPEYIKKHYTELKDRIFKKWASQTTYESRQWVMDWGFGNNVAREAPTPIFYQALPITPKEDAEWRERALRHLRARRYRKLRRVMDKMKERENELNKKQAYWFDRICGDINVILTKYPLHLEGEFYNEKGIRLAILAWGACSIEDDKIVFGGESRKEPLTLACVKDATKRDLVLGELRLVQDRYRARPVEMEMDWLFKERNAFLGRIITEIENSHLLDGECDIEDPSHPLDRKLPKW